MKKNSGNIPRHKMAEFEGKMKNYISWRWSGVSFYQSFFIVFVTSAILLFADIITGGDLILRVIILVLLIILSFDLYRKMLRQTSKPVFVCENLIGTLEGKPTRIKEKCGKGYLAFNLSGIHHEEVKR